VTRLSKSMAIRSDPIPRMTRWTFASRAISLYFSSAIGTTFGGFSMNTAWPMLAGQRQLLTRFEVPYAGPAHAGQARFQACF